MLARTLQLALGLQVLCALALAGHGLAVLLPFLLPVLLAAVAMAIARLWSPPRPGGFPALRAAIAEMAAFLALYDVIMPFERWWAGDDDPPEPGRPYVLLVSGYLCNRALWWWMARRLRRAGLKVASVSLDPPLGGIDALAERIRRKIASLPPGTPVLLVGHSMGGLAARASFAPHGAGRVRRLITIATPHRGTAWAWVAPGRNARQMEPGSAWLSHLGAPPVPTLAIWSIRDSIVIPPDSACLDGAECRALGDIGHLALVFSSRMLAVILRAASEMQPFQDLDE